MYTQIFLVTSVRGNTLPRLLHGSRILLGICRLSLLASRLLRRRDLLQLTLRDRRLLGRGGDRGH